MTSRITFPLILSLAILLAACSPVSSDLAAITDTPPVVTVLPVISTAISGSVSVGTVEPFIVTEPPPGYTPPSPPPPPTLTPIPAIAGGLGPTELKYLLLDQFPNLFFCDPDQFPVAHEDIYKLAKERFSDVQANAEEFNAILEHNHLSGLSSFSDEQMLLVYQEHKKLAAIIFTLDQAGYRFQLQSAESEGNGTLISGVIDSQGKITVQKKDPVIATCPICLAKGALIDTPSGLVQVEDLVPGMQVWTLDRAGSRMISTVLWVSKTIVPAKHKVVHLVLEDGRQLWVSPGHPTADGRLIGQLRPGDLLDGSRVVSVERLAYSAEATYDLLPSGATGFYWADGILIASTLHR